MSKKDGLVSLRTLRDGLAQLEEQARADAPFVPEEMHLREKRLLGRVRELIDSAEVEDGQSVTVALAARNAAREPTDAPTVLAGCRGLIPLPVGRMSGVYFLVEKGAVVYVGQSVDVLRRLTGHPHVHDGAYVLPVPESLLLAAEEALIHHLKPRFNSFYRSGGGNPALAKAILTGEGFNEPND